MISLSGTKFFFDGDSGEAAAKAHGVTGIASEGTPEPLDTIHRK
jgi:hypothetical protein